MPRNHYKSEEIVAKLRQVDVLVSQGRSVVDAIRAIGVTEVSYYTRFPISVPHMNLCCRQPALAASPPTARKTDTPRAVFMAWLTVVRRSIFSPSTSLNSSFSNKSSANAVSMLDKRRVPKRLPSFKRYSQIILMPVSWTRHCPGLKGCNRFAVFCFHVRRYSWNIQSSVPITTPMSTGFASSPPFSQLSNAGSNILSAR
jgi:hypothetical protein